MLVRLLLTSFRRSPALKISVSEPSRFDPRAEVEEEDMTQSIIDACSMHRVANLVCCTFRTLGPIRGIGTLELLPNHQATENVPYVQGNWVCVNMHCPI